MAEMARPRPIEYYNPRPLILGICFIWGIVVGFGLYFFRAPEAPSTPQTRTSEATSANPTPQLPDRNEGVPVITEIDTAAPVASRPSLDTMTVLPPQPALIIEGGLSGKVSPQLYVPVSRTAPPTTTQPQFTAPSPPPIPELMP